MMLKVNNDRRGMVHYPNGNVKPVKNLGWLLRHRKEVTLLEWRDNPPRDGYSDNISGLFIAHLTDKRQFLIEFNCREVWAHFIHRPTWAHIPKLIR